MRIIGLLLLFAPLGGCTLATDAGDRSFVRGLDIDFTFRGMNTPHPGEVMDVAVVLSRGDASQLQGRALISLPPPPAGEPGPEQRLVLERAVQPGAIKLVFFADDRPENGMFDEPEHHWVRPVPENGEGEFDHDTFFDPFFEFADGSNLTLAGPASAAQRDCLEGLLAGFSTLEVKVFNVPEDDRQVGYVRLDSQSRLRVRPLPLTGIIDEGSEYRFEVLVNGMPGRTPFQQQLMGDTQLALNEWFPAGNDQIAACLAQP